jgi:hypothetical protein
MTRFFMALGVLTMAGIVAVGCGGDDDTGNTGNAGTSSKGGETTTGGEAPSNGGETTAGGETTTGGQTTTTGGETAAGGSNGNVSCDPSVMGVCQNATDCGPVASGQARMAAGSCGKSCLGSANKSCDVDCIIKATKMTNPCATCYADAAKCAANKCLAECIADPESDGCKKCQVDMGCRSDFDKCSGLTE